MPKQTPSRPGPALKTGPASRRAHASSTSCMLSLLWATNVHRIEAWRLLVLLSIRTRPCWDRTFRLQAWPVLGSNLGRRRLLIYLGEEEATDIPITGAPIGTTLGCLGQAPAPVMAESDEPSVGITSTSKWWTPS